MPRKTAVVTDYRPIREIAAEIRRYWAPVDLDARPYLDAMAHLDRHTDKYICDGAQMIILYFLNNAQKFRGEHARRLKAELNVIARLP